MSNVKMSIHRALSELKTYDARIQNGKQRTFVAANKKSNEKISGMSVDEIKNLIKGNFDSIKALIENRKRIKAAISLSNAITKRAIGGIEYTIAEVIDRKNAIEYEETLLAELKNQFKVCNNKVENENVQMPGKLETYLQSVLGEKDKRSLEDIQKYTKDFESRNMYELIDPCNISTYIETLEESILNFKNEVDYSLSESNAITTIEVELVD